MSLGSTSASSLRRECSISQANNYWAFVTGIFQGSYLTQRVTRSSKRQRHQQKAELCQFIIVVVLPLFLQSQTIVERLHFY